MTPDELVAERLRRVADRYQPADGLTGVFDRVRARRRRRRARRAGAAMAVIAVAVAAVVVVGQGGGHQAERVRVAAPPTAPGPPLADPALTPKGWAPVGAGAIEISVPSRWPVEDPGSTCSGGNGQVFVLEAPNRSAPGHCAGVTNVVIIRHAPKQPLEHPRDVSVNGIPTIQASANNGGQRWSVERALGMQIEARGPLARRVLSTLTHSPLSVVLHASLTTVPANWRTRAFGGLRFSTPPSWTVSDQPGYPGCPYPITARVVGLQNANSLDVPSCPPPPTTAGYDAARPGLVVVAGRHVPQAPTDATCRTRAGLRVCVDPPPTSGGLQPGHELSLLTAQVYLPGERRPDQIELGLAGSGLQAAQVFDSIAPARAGRTAAGSRATVTQVHHFVTALSHWNRATYAATWSATVSTPTGPARAAVTAAGRPGKWFYRVTPAAAFQVATAPGLEVGYSTRSYAAFADRGYVSCADPRARVRHWTCISWQGIGMGMTWNIERPDPAWGLVLQIDNQIFDAGYTSSTGPALGATPAFLSHRSIDQLPVTCLAFGLSGGGNRQICITDNGVVASYHWPSSPSGGAYTDLQLRSYTNHPDNTSFQPPAPPSNATQ